MLRRVSGVVSSIAQGYRAGPATYAVGRQRARSATYGDGHIPRVLSVVSQGHRVGPATTAVHGERGRGSTYGERPAAAPPSIVQDKVAFHQRSFAQHTVRRGISSGYTRQMMSYSEVDLNDKEWVHPVDYYRQKKIMHWTVNKLVTKSKEDKLVIVHDDTALSFHSITGLLVENHLGKISVSKALHLDNLRVHMRTGDWAFVQLDANNTCPLKSDNEIEDFRTLHAVIVKLLHMTHGMHALKMLPFAFTNFLGKLISDNLQVQHIICNSLFLPALSRLLLRVLLDIKLRRPLRTGYCPNRNQIKRMFQNMPFVLDGDLLDAIISGNEFLDSLQNQNNLDQLKWAESEEQLRGPRTNEETRSYKELELDLMIKIASRLIGIQRDAVLHFPKTKMPEGSEKLLIGIDIKKVIHLLNIELPDFEQRSLELLAEHGLWDFTGATQLFGKYAARLPEVIERDKRRAAEKDERMKSLKDAEAADSTGGEG